MGDPTSANCAESCPGGESKFVPDGYGGEGYYAQLCPDPEKASDGVATIEFCGNGPNVIVFFRPTMPTDAEILARAMDECL